MTTRVLLLIGVLSLVLIGFLIIDKFQAENAIYKQNQEYNLLLEQYEGLKMLYAKNESAQQEYARQIDSLTNVKQKINYRYEKDIDTIYSMPDSVVFGLLTKHLDSLYVHRFNKFITQ